MSKTTAIEINFPVAVKLTSSFKSELHILVESVCKQYEKDNPDRIMWQAEHGDKMLANPMMSSYGGLIEFDTITYCINAYERENLCKNKKEK